VTKAVILLILTKVQSIPGLQAGPFGSMLAKAHDNPQSLFNVLLSPDTLKQIPLALQQVLLPPLKIALADSLHMVFFAAMLITIAGIFVSLLMGNARIEKKLHRPVLKEKVEELLAKGVTVEG